MRLLLFFVVARLYGAKSMYHISVFLSRAPTKHCDESMSCFNISVWAVDMALYSLSQNYDMNNSTLFSIFGNTWHFCSAVGMFGIFRRTMCVTSIVMLLGKFIIMPRAHFFMFV